MKPESETSKEILHNLSENLQKHIARIERLTDISPENKALILKFKDHCLAKGLSVTRAIMYLDRLQVICQIGKFDLKTAKKDDIKKLMATVESKQYAQNSKEMYKVTLKVFYKWVYGIEGDDKPPKLVSWIKRVRPKGKLSREDLLSEEEFRKLLDGCNHKRDKAMLMCLYEGALRPAELRSMTIGSLVFNHSTIKAKVNGKTGERYTYFISAVPSIQDWLAMHPRKQEPSAPLWCNLTRNGYGRVITHINLAKLVNRLAIKCGIKTYKTYNKVNGTEIVKTSTKLYPYVFRHSRLTALYLKMPESVVKKIAGHCPDSRMAAVYQHLVDDDVETELLKINGIAPQVKEGIVEFTPKTCPRCQTVNRYTSSMCCKCSMVLDLSTAVTVDKNNETLEQLTSNPALMDKFKEFLNSPANVEELVNKRFETMKKEDAQSP